jgi:hypothetical protein
MRVAHAGTRPRPSRARDPIASFPTHSAADPERETLMNAISILQAKLDEMVAMGTDALAERDLPRIERLDQKLRSIDALCRESFQDTFADTYASIAGKLERGQAINTMERKALEILFTGEAEYYLKTENNFNDWIEELQRLMGELRAAREDGLENIAELMRVQALCRDALHVLPEVQYYLREQERVELFRESLSEEITPEAGRMLARMVRDMMASPNR